jgi:hypothetical protein
VIRILVLLLGMLTTSRTAPFRRTSPRDDDQADDDQVVSALPSGSPETLTRQDTVPVVVVAGTGRRGKRRRIPRWVKWAAVIAVIGLVFRRAMAFVTITALSAALHLVGINAHLPHIKFEWPWQTISAGTTTDVIVGPWVLQKIQGIDHPALGTENFNFLFTHKVSKSIGFWPCWYQATFYAVGHASATVDLNPGPAWWKQSTGHYQLDVLSRPAGGKPGSVTVSMALPQPQLPQSVHDVSIDNTLSQPISTEHSWTYPGFGCGMVLKPQFAESVLYSQAQSLAFDRVNNVSSVTQPLINAAENEAVQIIRNNFIQPTLNAIGYTLTQFNISWVGASGDQTRE